ncbi:MAG: PAS domain S-box protein [Rhodospirillaceae bacterium]
MTSSEVDLLNLIISLKTYLNAPSEDNHVEVQYKFDILWSRMDVIVNGAPWYWITQVDRGEETFQQLSQILTRFDPLIFDADVLDVFDAQALIDDLTALQASLHVVILETYQKRNIRLSDLNGEMQELVKESSFYITGYGLISIFIVALLILSRRQVLLMNASLEKRVLERTEDLQKSEARTRAIIDNAADGIIVIDQGGKIQSFSPASETIFGYAAAEVIGQNVKMLMPEPMHSEHDGYLAAHMATGKSAILGRNREVTGLRKTGETFPMDLAIGKTILGDELIYTGIVRDITEAQKWQNELLGAYDVISSSIEYASRIQHAALPDHQILDALVGDYFVWWEPRDVVGGDFYWVGTWGDGIVILLGDCTGHGVPGAFMTLITIAALERTMSEVPGGELGKLITRTHQFVQIMLRQNNAGGDSDDGLELGACYIGPDETQITFAGARSGLIVLSDGAPRLVKGTKAGMGYRKVQYIQEYKEEIIALKDDMQFYLVTDGIIDQVGGSRKRSFGRNALIRALEANKALPMAEQKQKLQAALAEFQGEESRRDDLSMIGFKF